MRRQRRPWPSIPRLDLLIVVAVILGLVSVPVECALAAGPHSLYQSPSTMMGDDEPPSHAHGRHDATAPDAPVPSPGAMDRNTTAPTLSATTPQTASLAMAASGLMGMTGGGLDLAVPAAGPGDGPSVREESRASLWPQTGAMPNGFSPAPDPPPPRVNFPN